MKRDQLSNCRRIVIKVGSSLLEDEHQGSFIESLAGEIHQLTDRGRELLVVSSGAILFGMHVMGRDRYPVTLPEKQATAAVGQTRLMNFYSEALSEYDIITAQVLLTQQGIHNRETYLNASNTLNALLEMDTVPVINENDTEATEEIQFGDNDTLSALVTTLTDADLLVVLSDVGGLYPRGPDVDEEPYREIDEITPEIRESAGPSRSDRATVGGMVTKVEAAEKITEAGTPMVIASGHEERVLGRILEGESIGTLFRPHRGERAIQGRKRWIRHHLPCKGTITVDDGAREALVTGGKSLLPSGVLAVDGQFRRGDAVRVTDERGGEFARGLINYKAGEVEKLKGCQTDAISGILGYHDFDEIIHRDNLVVFNGEKTDGGR